MAGSKHLFLSQDGEGLPRWQQLFADGRVARIGAATGPSALVWLRLPGAESPVVQLQRIREACLLGSCIVLSDEPQDDEALLALSAGARGYANSHATAEVLQQIAMVVSQGGLWVGESLMQKLIARSVELVKPPVDLSLRVEEVLTQRELEVARTIVTGASNKEIARQLHIAERTVKAHISAIFDKLQVRDRLQLAMLIRDQQSR
ncbi:response regulator transcription factor [uncultured Oxalicibacterium sp.]|uniref:response regulator transcription factor n=1 Tax=uncultured Oxalicibacterium sp. TaxID=1168540 RepID=UPI0025CFBFBD|nr:response regulator transcription factor [uncultured Oxalicibacterium sp.]